MSEPKLTICVPTLDRAQFLDRALLSCVSQRTPVKVIVSDQGKSEATAKIVSKYAENPNIRRIDSPAETLWQNWRFALEQADTEFVAILQDDDTVSPEYAGRIVGSFANWPEAHCWIARLTCSADGTTGIWYSGNGPLVPLDMMTGRTTIAEGSMFTPVAYCTSMALSPAVAFRRGEPLANLLATVPDSCDLYTERLVLASIGEHHPIICDPFCAGYWVQHADNTSRRQHASQGEQQKVAIAWLDDLMDRIDEWKYPFRQWVDHLPLGIMSAMGMSVFADSMEQSRHCKALRDIFRKAAEACNGPQSGMPPEFGPVVVNTDIMQPNKPMTFKMPPTVEADHYECEEMVEAAAG